jgi:hypothetical protein
MESGQMKLILLAHMVLERINLRGLWLRVSPELYSCFGRIIIRHGVSEFMMIVEGLLLGRSEELSMMMWRQSDTRNQVRKSKRDSSKLSACSK